MWVKSDKMVTVPFPAALWICSGMFFFFFNCFWNAVSKFIQFDSCAVTADLERGQKYASIAFILLSCLLFSAPGLETPKI